MSPPKLSSVLFRESSVAHDLKFTRRLDWTRLKDEKLDAEAQKVSHGCSPGSPLKSSYDKILWIS